ncbi:MAG: cell envelope integrity protein CreD [Bacteroidales bacterium]|nr:cell envelope integrity protein CreD [Bacteroidales bacterium]
MENNETNGQNVMQAARPADNGTQSTLPNSNVKKEKTGTKLVVISLICILLLIPWFYIKYMISDRDNTRRQAKNEVTEKWGGRQLIKGPAIKVNCSNPIIIMPDSLNINADVTTQQLHRGIYDFTVFESTIEMEGTFALPKTEGQKLNDNIAKSKCTMQIELGSLKDLSDNPVIEINGRKIDNQYINFNDNILEWSYNPEVLLEGAETKYHITMKLKGSNKLSFMPTGNTTTARMHSNCATPSFGGRFLPTERKVTDEGFDAEWRILAINRSIPQVVSKSQWDNIRSECYSDYDEYIIDGDNIFSIELRKPVEQYHQNERAVKYAYLIILLTFAVVFFIEVRRSNPIHPVQYLLIGIAIMLFYTLLLSFSEQLSFLVAYIIASIMTIGLLSYYLGAIMHERKIGLLIGGILTAVYSFIYILLQLENLALMVGSIGLFIILTIIMTASKRIEWYK